MLSLQVPGDPPPPPPSVAWLLDGARVAWTAPGAPLYCAAVGGGPPRALLAPGDAAGAVRVAVSGEGAVAAVRAGGQLQVVPGGGAGPGAALAKKGGKLLGVHWVQPDVLLLVHDQGLDLYQLGPPPAGGLRLLRDARLPVVWYRYDARVVVAGVGGAQLVAYVVKAGGRLERLGKASVECRGPPRPLFPFECHLLQLYQRLFFAYVDSPHGELHLLQITSAAVTPKKRLSFLLPAASGKVTLSVVDNLLLVHQLDAGVLMLFDTRDASAADSLYPLVAPLPLQPSPAAEQGRGGYGADWVFADGPHVLALAAAALLELRLDLAAVAAAIDEPVRRLAFLLRRRGAKPLVVRILREALLARASLAQLAAFFDLLNAVVASTGRAARAGASRGASEEEVGEVGAPAPPAWPAGLSLASPASPRPAAAVSEETERRSEDGVLVIDQSDMYSLVLQPVEEERAGGDRQWARYLVGALVEYVRSLNFHLLPVEHFVHELLIDQLVRSGRFNQLHQFLQYHVLADSPQVACQLLALEPLYPPACQLALDMLKRLAPACPEQIVEVLLSRRQLLPALRILKAAPHVRASPLRFLDAAEQLLQQNNDSTLFYTVYTYFFDPAAPRRPDGTPLAATAGPLALADRRALDHFTDIFDRLFGGAAPPAVPT